MCISVMNKSCSFLLRRITRFHKHMKHLSCSLDVVSHANDAETTSPSERRWCGASRSQSSATVGRPALEGVAVSWHSRYSCGFAWPCHTSSTASRSFATGQHECEKGLQNCLHSGRGAAGASLNRTRHESWGRACPLWHRNWDWEDPQLQRIQMEECGRSWETTLSDVSWRAYGAAFRVYVADGVRHVSASDALSARSGTECVTRVQRATTDMDLSVMVSSVGGIGALDIVSRTSPALGDMEDRNWPRKPFENQVLALSLDASVLRLRFHVTRHLGCTWRIQRPKQTVSLGNGALVDGDE